MLILISTNIIGMVLDLIDVEFFHFLLVDLVINFDVDISSSIHVDNKEKNILILGEGPTQGLDDTTLTAEKSTQLILFNFV